MKYLSHDVTSVLFIFIFYHFPSIDMLDVYLKRPFEAIFPFCIHSPFHITMAKAVCFKTIAYQKDGSRVQHAYSVTHKQIKWVIKEIYLIPSGPQVGTWKVTTKL